MRFVLQKIVLQAVKLESDTRSSLVPVTTPIAEASYQRASEIISSEIQTKCDEWRDQITAFKVFNEEHSQDMAKNKEKWDSLPEVEKRDFIARVVAEENFKQQLRQ